MLTDALEVLKQGLEVDPENSTIKEMMEEVVVEIEQDNVIPPEHPERKRF